MSPPEAIAAARAAGVQIAIDGDDLVLEASAPPPDAILDLLTRHKLGIVTLLQPGRDRWPAQIEPVDADAIEERAALAAGSVPACYLDTWALLNHQKPACVSEAEWLLVLDDGGRFLDAWGNEAADLGWTPAELFGPKIGLVWRLTGLSVKAIGPDHVLLSDLRIVLRVEMRGLR